MITDTKPGADIGALVRAAQAGDVDAFGGIYRAFRTPVYEYFARRVHNHALVEDLTSEVFVRVLRHIGTFRRGTFEAWLFTIARNLVIDHHRMAWVRLEVTVGRFHENAGPTVPSCEDIHIAAWGVRVLLDATRRLTHSQRQCFALRALAGLTAAQTAEVTGCSAGAVRVHQSRAARRLRRDVRVRALRESAVAS